MQTAGLHHITAYATNAQANADFYTGALGLRLVKRTVNFDRPELYHLYYGDHAGNPGTLLTFFPVPEAAVGRAGPGMATAITLAVKPAALDGWAQRLAGQGHAVEGPFERFGAAVIAVRDPDGLRIELEAVADAVLASPADTGAIAGIHAVPLTVTAAKATAALLTEVFGYVPTGEAADALGSRRRYSTRGPIARHIDLIEAPHAAPGSMGGGSIHHIAFRALDDAEQLQWREAIAARGFNVTEVRDRTYFHSIYFHEPGGVLFEIATDPPGFTIDEPLANLGAALQLPAWLERRRAEIERQLPGLR